MCWFVVGVLCENCIVDASIKHTGWIAFLWFVCVCLCDFFFVFILSSSLVWPPALFVCGGLCVRY